MVAWYTWTGQEPVYVRTQQKEVPNIWTLFESSFRCLLLKRNPVLIPIIGMLLLLLDFAFSLPDFAWG